LDDTERLNDLAMYAIYEGSPAAFTEHEDDELLGVASLSEAEELLRNLRADDPGLFNRIANLRDGVRSARRSAQSGCVVFCEASSPMDGERRYQQLFHVDANGTVVTRDLRRVLSVLACRPEEPSMPIPGELNEHVMRVRRLFAEEVKHRESDYEHSVTLSHAQKFVIRELRVVFGATADEDLKGQINLLEQAFRHRLTEAARRDINGLRRDKLTGLPLVDALKRIYTRHGVGRWLATTSQARSTAVPKVVCSEALML
jgi:hypothetical protein